MQAGGLGLGLLVVEQVAVDDVRQAAFEDAQCLGPGLPSRPQPFVKSAGRWMDTWSELGERDDVQGCIELAVTAAVEADADVVTAPDRYRRRSGMQSEGCLAGEAVDPGRLADQYRRGQHADSGHGQQIRRQWGHPVRQPPVQRRDPLGQRPDVFHQLHRDLATHRDRTRVQPAQQLNLRTLAAQLPQTRRQIRVEGMAMPAQTVDDPGAFANQATAVIHHKPQLQGLFIQPGRRQPRLTLRGAGHGQGIDRIRLPALTDRGTSPGLSMGGTATTLCPPARRSRNSPPATWRQSSTAHRTGSPNRCAQVTARR
ncbi:hypothetical protein AN219_10235 [Streptomyces nanshensis]|nr:hypothetical protein AN219_10235 [Streptomyces nanshensis]